MQGQDAVNTAKAFKEALPLTGIVLTKIDGDSRGGAALSVRQITGAPIKFAGISEKIDGLEVFDAERHAGRILGMGDIVGAGRGGRRRASTSRRRRSSPTRSRAGDGFDLNDFLSQISADEEDGRPVEPDGQAARADGRPRPARPTWTRAERDIRRMEGIISSMTPLERRKPELLKATRKRRIAAGAGVQVQEVNRLLNQFEQMQGHDEEDEGRRPDEDDEAHGRHEGHAAACAERGRRAGRSAMPRRLTHAIAMDPVCCISCWSPLLSSPCRCVWWLARRTAPPARASEPTGERLDTARRLAARGDARAALARAPRLQHAASSRCPAT